MPLFGRRSPAAIVSRGAVRSESGFWPRMRDYLFGAGSVIDLMPVPDSVNLTFHTSDREAIAADWRAVGQDMRQSTAGALPFHHRRVPE